MSVTGEFNPVGKQPATAIGSRRKFGPAVLAGLRALGAGWRAAVDYRRLNDMSDRQLKLRGLSRSDIPQELHRRHFASLTVALENIG